MKQKAFSLTEPMVAIGLVAILGSAMSSFYIKKSSPKDSATRTSEKQVRAAILNPTFISPAEATLADGTEVLGVTIGGKSRAYPLLIIDKHRIVNDTVGGKHIVCSSA